LDIAKECHLLHNYLSKWLSYFLVIKIDILIETHYLDFAQAIRLEVYTKGRQKDGKLKLCIFHEFKWMGNTLQTLYLAAQRLSLVLTHLYRNLLYLCPCRLAFPQLSRLWKDPILAEVSCQLGNNLSIFHWPLCLLMQDSCKISLLFC